MDVLSWTAVGLLAGLAASLLVSREGAGFLGDITFGISGAMVGGVAAGQITGAAGFDPLTFASALGGALLLLVAYRVIIGTGIGRAA